MTPIAPARIRPIADALAAALAASLPWSTSATAILGVCWLIAALPCITFDDMRRQLRSAAGGLPVLLWALGVVGMLWADVSWPERFEGLGSFHKLLLVPFFLAYFSRSDGAWKALAGFIAGCSALLVFSALVIVFPSLMPVGKWHPGVPVKDYIAQAAMFTVCIFVLAALALEQWRRRRIGPALAAAVLSALFFLNVLYVATSRTALVVMPVLMLAFGLIKMGWKGTLGFLAAIAVLVALIWPSATFLQHRVLTLATEISQYRLDGEFTSGGERIEFWRKSLLFIRQAPVIGHGTGTIPDLFRKAAGESGLSAIKSVNPHQQTFAVGIQLGLMGMIVLWAMWLSHLALFRGRASGVATLLGWTGFVIVAQNVVGSLFNSHLFDFTHGWAYVVGVGIAGGAALHARRRARLSADAPP